MDYSNFEIEDFAANDSFIRWVLAPDHETVRFWTNFMIENPSFDAKISRARELVLNLKEVDETSPDLVRANMIWNRIEPQLSAHQDTSDQSLGRFFSPLTVAATVSILVLASFGIYQLSDTDFKFDRAGETLADIDFLEELNTSGSLLRIYLGDGSVVSLEDNSRLRYPKHFTGRTNREVYLTGEGFFDVAKNSKQPFLVHTKSITTKVLGTSFRIKAYENEKDIVVAVKEGKVSVFSYDALKKSKEHESEVNGVVLIPNQKVTYNVADNSFDKTLVDNPEKVDSNPPTTSLVFENSPVREVFSALERLYGIEIIFDEDAMENCFLTVPLGEEPLFEKLNIICRTIGASYELIDAAFVINGKGC